MKQTISFVLICIIVAASCGRARSKKQSVADLPYLVEIEKGLDKAEPVPLSSIGKKLEYIPLETTPASLIESIYHIAFNDSSIFISDYRKLLQFDRNGRFIRQIGSEGRGPEEYVEVADFCVNNESIFILATPKILVFDLQGRFVRSFNIPFTSIHFMIKDTNNLMFYSANIPGSSIEDTVYSWNITDNEGILKAKLLNFHKRINKGFNIGEMPLYNFKGISHFIEFGSDTLLYFNNETPVPYALISLGNMKMETDPVYPSRKGDDNAKIEVINRLAQKLWISSVNENEEHLFFRLSYGYSDSSRYGIFDKSTLQTTILKDKGFFNDLDEGISFWPKYVYNDNILVDYIDAFELIMIIKKKQRETSRKKRKRQYEEFDKLAGQLDEFSNPVLMILK